MSDLTRGTEATLVLPEKAARSSQRLKANFWTRRVDEPTYVRDIVGPVERFDLRDAYGNRMALQPGTSRYQAYYAQHPELEEKDARSRSRYLPQEEMAERRWGHFSDEPIALAFSESVDHSPRFGGPHFSEGTVNERKVELDPVRASEVIKGCARWLGADLVGICRLNPAWVYSHEGSGERWGEPIEVPLKYAISIAVGSDWGSILAAREGKALPGSYMTHHYVFGPLVLMASRLAAFIRALGYSARAEVRSGSGNPDACVIEQAVAVDAGLGEMGRQGLLITKEYGAAVHIRTVTTDLPLAVDKPVDYGIQDFCARCFKCADVCTTGAVPQGDKEAGRGIKMWRIDEEKCLAIRRAHGNVACISCMSCCEFTEPRNIIHRTAAELAIRGGAPARAFLIWLHDALYGKRPRSQRYPDWLEFKPPAGWRERISYFLNKV